jgi:hypothetical protein
MITHKVLDAAFPPQTLPPGVQAVAGYVGGRATHTWTLAEWLRFAHVPQFPIWVPDTDHSPALEAAAAVDAILHRGWAPRMPQPGTRALIWDMETTVAASWCQAAQTVAANNGFILVGYGSESTIFKNGLTANISAEWNSVPEVMPGEHGHQYQANVRWEGTTVDYSVFDAWLFARGGVGPRKGT